MAVPEPLQVPFHPPFPTMLILGVPVHVWAIPAAFVTAYLPAFYRNFSIRRFAGGYNNINPRKQIADFEAKQRLTKEQVRTQAQPS